MKTLSIREMRGALSRIDKLAMEEGEIVITRRGKPIARLLPVKSVHAKPDHAALRAKMPRLATASASVLRVDRDER